MSSSGAVKASANRALIKMAQAKPGSSDSPFVAGDSGELSKVADDLRNSADRLAEKIEEMYSLFESFPKDEAWSGVTYNTFWNEVNGMRNNLESVVDILNALANICEEDIIRDVDVLKRCIDGYLHLSFQRGRDR